MNTLNARVYFQIQEYTNAIFYLKKQTKNMNYSLE